jgi:hypothetical protein
MLCQWVISAGPASSVSDVTSLMRFRWPGARAHEHGRCTPITGLVPGQPDRGSPWADIAAKVGGWLLRRNNRIAGSKFLNQHCASAADLESMLLTRRPKIFLQQYRPTRDSRTARIGDCGPLRRPPSADIAGRFLNVGTGVRLNVELRVASGPVPKSWDVWAVRKKRA